MSPADTDVALVTGAANGIGAAVAERLRRDGLLVVAVDLEPCADPWIEADVAQIEGHEALVERAAGHGRLVALANVAGISIAEPLAELSVASYRRQLGILLDGPIWLARAAGLHMAEGGGGRIVNISSIHASVSERGMVAYDAAKGGLEAATRTLAIELGPSVLVNSVAPGFVRTRMAIVEGRDELETNWFREGYVESGRIPTRRPAEPAEIAETVAFLLSSRNTYVNGARLVVDGGLTVTF